MFANWLLRAFAVDDDNGRSSDEQRFKSNVYERN